MDNRLIEGYLETRRDPIVCALEPGMYAGYFDWASCSKPSIVRPYIKLCLIEVVAVHAELHSVSHKLLVSVLPKVRNFQQNRKGVTPGFEKGTILRGFCSPFPFFVLSFP